jgi:diguanylate cyclase (GGDEF)-like protein
MQEVAERLRRSIAETDINSIKVTVSIGAAYFDGRRIDNDYTAFVELADNALYEAKASGRNRVVTRIKERTHSPV